MKYFAANAMDHEVCQEAASSDHITGMSIQVRSERQRAQASCQARSLSPQQ